MAYVGPLRGFNLELSGTLNGQVVRVGYNQNPYDSSPPSLEFTTLGRVSVPFTAVKCPVWSSSCSGASSNPYSLTIQLVGGDVKGPYVLCMESLTPIL
jgi:hypothetical protein